MADTEFSEEARLPIREVARRTGVHPMTLRAWERRYGLLAPARTHKGHRLYSDGEVRRIEKVLACLARGVAIGQVRELLERGTGKTAYLEKRNLNNSCWQEILDETCSLLQDFAEPQLRCRVDQWITAFPPPLLLEHWLKPLHAKLGQPRLEESRSAKLFLWPLLYEQLLLANGIARKNLRKHKKSTVSRLLLMDLPGDDQRVFLQMFSAALFAAGIDVVVLSNQADLKRGGNVVKKLDCRGLICYSHRALPKNFLTQELLNTAQALDKPFWLAGDFVEMQRDDLGKLGKIANSSVLLGATDSVLTQLQEQLIL
ncbi:MerR family transcriptional regulator [Microbulbifer epialgicus]|uniref:MerR family transcriptional regulator n=1 Tax=Microbulbifer epialgicus TaxID=393907 RepID=A0ABV4NYT9_9GAMM